MKSFSTGTRSHTVPTPFPHHTSTEASVAACEPSRDPEESMIASSTPLLSRKYVNPVEGERVSVPYDRNQVDTSALERFQNDYY
jgi:hypothetical protein